MMRNLFMSLLVAVFAASFMYLGELSGVTASNEEVAAVENCILDSTQTVLDSDDESFITTSCDYLASFYFRLANRGCKSRSNSGANVVSDFRRILSHGYCIITSYLYKHLITLSCSVPHYIYHRNLRI